MTMYLSPGSDPRRYNPDQLMLVDDIELHAMLASHLRGHRILFPLVPELAVKFEREIAAIEAEVRRRRQPANGVSICVVPN